MKSGILNLYKERGMTSHDAVAAVRRLFGTKKVGHTGTLDPEAEGVLPILIGSAVKACDLVPHERKTYLARVRFGVATDTEDVWGKVLAENSVFPCQEDWEEAIASFPAEYGQIPPMMSAVKIGGKKLYEHYRAGETVERKPRPCRIERLESVSFSREEAEIRATVSRGTYIRTLLTDLCRPLGVLGAMSALLREESGIFTLAGAVRLHKIEGMEKEEREALLIPVERLFSEEEIFRLPDFFDRLIMNGCAVSAEKLGLSLPEGTRVRLYQGDTFVALGGVMTKDGERVLKKIKNFDPD